MLCLSLIWLMLVCWFCYLKFLINLKLGITLAWNVLKYAPRDHMKGLDFGFQSTGCKDTVSKIYWSVPCWNIEIFAQSTAQNWGQKLIWYTILGLNLIRVSWRLVDGEKNYSHNNSSHIKERPNFKHEYLGRLETYYFDVPKTIQNSWLDGCLLTRLIFYKKACILEPIHQDPRHQAYSTNFFSRKLTPIGKTCIVLDETW